ncbi:MAG: hypothetical protein HRT45_08355 [Bdellovibrionales bacterium]|nr:hypothetical protein [Bdellovibrionales bacterium]
MKALNILELDSLVEAIEAFGEAELQTAIVSDRDFAFRFHGAEKSFWLCLDMNPQAPVVVLLDYLPIKFAKKKSPLGLFVEAHFVGASLTAAKRLPQFGRVLELHFNEDKSMQLRLFPHGQNLILNSSEKKISLQRSAELEEIDEEFEPTEVRSLAEVGRLWLEKRGATSERSEQKKSSVDTRVGAIKKLRKSLKKLEVEAESKKQQPWRLAGQWLASHQTLVGAPSELTVCFDQEQSFSWNLENCFARAKKTELKLQTILERKSELEEQLTKIEGLTDEQYIEEQKGHQKPQSFKLQTKQPVKTRKLELGSGATVFVGKSAKDNLQLLRKARAWDYWLHIKDVPSAHAIVFRNKGQQISESELNQAAKFLLQTTKSSNQDSLISQSAEVLLAEKRYVQPIKGDKHGRVTHRNAKTLNIKV